MSSGDFGLSQIPGNPSFRNAAVNDVAVVPLLSRETTSSTATHSKRSFQELMTALERHPTSCRTMSDLLLVVPNISLTRPGDWKYNDTPLKSFHWQQGCQRLCITDGRPHCSRQAHDRLLAPDGKQWMDLTPSKRTAAVVGVLNIQDCKSQQDLHRAVEELHSWATQYSTPPYAVTAHGKSFDRDRPIERLFVYDSFNETAGIDLSACTLGSSKILAFPPADEAHVQMMDLHLNVVINDLAVSIFRDVEMKLREYQLINPPEERNNNTHSAKDNFAQNSALARRAFQRYISGASQDNHNTSNSEEEAPQALKNLTISSMASLVNPDNKLAKESPTSGNISRTASGNLIAADRTASGTGIMSNGKAVGVGAFTIASSNDTAATATTTTTTTTTAGGGADDSLNMSQRSSSTNTTAANAANKLPPLLTPLDEYDEFSTSNIDLSSRDMATIRRRDLGRREKWCGDLSLLAGSPLDAYEHYLKAAELCKASGIDPLWHASALEGCAAAHIAMADCGGFNVDEYLENNFQLPEEVMQLLDSSSGRNQRGGGGSSGQYKQTLPEVVFALCEEALNTLNRNPDLTHLYAELLLKLAHYCAVAAEGHLRCRWGDGGEGCFAGNEHELLQQQQPRWTKTTVYKLLHKKDNYSTNPAATPHRVPGMGDMAVVNTHYRTKKVCELLHAVFSISSLDPATRVDVAAQSAMICMNGIKPTNWHGDPMENSKLARKAAFFSVVAAEALTMAKSDSARNLWLLSTQLYTRAKNPSHGGSGGSYGWATLRAYCLEALSMQGNSTIALEGALQLLSLLSEFQPEVRNEEEVDAVIRSPIKSPRKSPVKLSRNAKDVFPSDSPDLDDVATDDSEADLPPGLRSDFGINLEEVANPREFARNLRESYRQKQAKETTYLSNNSKWADSEPISSITVPFGELTTLSTSLRSLKCVWPIVDIDTCTFAQRRCLERIGLLRRSLPTMSGRELDSCSIYGSDGKQLPLYVSSAMAIEADSALEMQCVKKRTSPEKAKEGAMATFFNPYEAKKPEKSSTTRVAEEEERAMRIQFGNRLSLPLEVQRSQLEFANDTQGRVKAAALSFVIPPRTKAFTVHFPFTVLSKPTSEDGHDDNSDIFEVKGLDLACFGRSFFLPIQALSDASMQQSSVNLPESASVYPFRSIKKSEEITDDMKPRIETFPCQPRLHVLFAETGAPVDSFTIGLSDGEVFTIPSFCLENYMGPSGRGKIERLEIFSANVPGVSDKKLYDSDNGPAVDEDNTETFDDVTRKENMPPLKLRALVGDLQLNGVNGSEGFSKENATITFQIAAAYNMGEKIPKGITILIRFRYRGLSNSLTEVWRKREVALNIRATKGPRISSIAFRPDLARESALAEMSQASMIPRNVKLTKKKKVSINDSAPGALSLRRVGLDNEISICGDKSFFVLTVANETRSVVSLERTDGSVGGFENNPLESVTVRPGVSAKIPFVIPRIKRVDVFGKPIDFVSELIARTSLIWKSHKGGEAGPVKARGNIRIPPACLHEIIDRNPSFLSQVCQAPCNLDLFVGKPVSDKSVFKISLGKPVDVSVEVQIETWVPKDIIQSCSLTIEFRCGRKNVSRDPINSSIMEASESQEYFWAGKIRHTILEVAQDSKMKHSAKIAFCASGLYAVSACIKISRHGSSSEEVWWAPVAQTVDVEEMKYPAQ